ncbi:MAG: endonuclease/exonuclease/phosphatase family protein [Burkholderiales bacterium]|nr:endonuclease/exonuclease/phosphatase family protein [Burkholderiales bacterium]
MRIASLAPRHLLTRVAVATLALGVHVAWAQSFAVASWNVGWLMDAATHARWADACRRHDWPTNPATLSASARTDLAGLPYCDVHNGMTFPRERCASETEGWPRAARYSASHPCRDSADLADPTAYARKIDTLRAMFARLDAAGVRVVALQEVFDAAAARAILPPHWSVATTRELAGTPAIAQHVGIAWREPAVVRDLRAVTTLAASGFPDRPLRPGLAFTVKVGGKPVRVLVVHLKAGCRSRDLDTPLGARDAGLTAVRRDAVVTDCAILRYQLPALEAWVDANASRDFALLGDFNRALLREPVADSATQRIRADGSATSTPLGTCSIAREGGRATVHCTTRTRAMFPELNDGEPQGAILWRARPMRVNGKAVRCTLAGTRGNLAQNDIDHILIGASLKARLTPAALALDIVNYGDAGTPLSIDPATALPSDHCPHVVTWTPRQEPRP